MKEIKAISKKVKLTVGEKEYFIQSPTNRQLQEFIEDKEENGLKKSILFLDKLGLPADVAWDLDPETLEQIIEAITPQKKQ